MTEPGLTTPLQPVRRERGIGPIAVALLLVAILGVIVWRPWSAEGHDPAGEPGSSPPAVVGSSAPANPTTLGPGGSPDASAGSDLFAGPTTGPWSGRVTGAWSIVAFLRPDPVSRESLTLRQQQVAVFVGLQPGGADPGAICDAQGTFLHDAAADLPARAVYFLGIAFPADRDVFVAGVYRVGQLALGARPVELGRIPGDSPRSAIDATPTAAPTPTAGPTVAVEPVRMFALPDGGAWPDGVYRFDVYTRDGLPGQLFACIRP
ncbi:MAG: hypothetical protein QOF11_431 [Chloroflexota bacterium]|jgi:hypothetical protein|nr:hypothetical protein [Chloroflexota bacterium]